MIIWIMTLVILAAAIVLGYTQGAIKVAIVTLGLLIGCTICVPASVVLHPLFAKLGVHNPLITLYVSPIVVLIIVQIIARVIANAVHHQVMTFYKYKAAEFENTLWVRTN